MTDIVATSSDKGRKMESCHSFRSGILTSESLTKELLHSTREWLMSLPQGFPVSRSQSPDSRKRKRTSETAGRSYEIPLARYDHDTSSWKMSQVSFLPSMSGPSSERLPQWGTIRDGALYPQPTQVQGIYEKGGGYWATPDANDRGVCVDKRTPEQKGGGGRALQRDVAEKMWPSPKESDYKGTGPPNSKSQLHDDMKRNLKGDSRLWPTPNQDDANNATGVSGEYKSLTRDATESGKAQGQLNPDWVEHLMGWVIGWSSLEPLSEESFNGWLQGQHTGTQDGEKIICRRCMQRMWGSKYIRPTSSRRQPNEQPEKQYTDSLQIMSRKKTQPLEKPQKGKRLLALRKNIYLQTAKGNGLQSELCEQTGMVESQQGVNQASENKWACVCDKTMAWWDADPADYELIPRVATNIKDRVNRLKAIGNGMVPQTFALAWRLLNQ